MHRFPLARSGLVRRNQVESDRKERRGIFTGSLRCKYPRYANYLMLMMATGLTFGTISSLYGLTHRYITQAQYTALVTMVILTAVVPTATFA